MLSYDDVHLELSNFFAKSGMYELFNLKKLSLKENRLQMQDAHLYTKYSKKELIQQIAAERDHIDLKIPNTIIIASKVYYQNDRLKIGAKSGNIDGLKLDLYRDKSPSDDLRKKPLYGALLKSLHFKLTFGPLDI